MQAECALQSAQEQRGGLAGLLPPFHKPLVVYVFFGLLFQKCISPQNKNTGRIPLCYLKSIKIAVAFNPL